MKHEVTTMNTKRMLAASLKNLMKLKPLSKISVSEIAADCGVNRKTFYYHFEDIQALLKWTLEQEAFEVVKGFDLILDSEEAIIFILNYVEENKHILNCAYDSIGRDELKRFFHSDFHEVVMKLICETEDMLGIRTEDAYRQFLCDFYSNAITGQIIEILRTRKPYDKEMLIGYLTETMKSTLPAALSASVYKNVSGEAQ